MKYCNLPKTDLKVSKICMGTMTFGKQNDPSSSHQICDYALDHGINFFDTAEIYPVPLARETYGSTEEILGPWLKTKPREDIVLATKLVVKSESLSFIRNGPAPKKEQFQQAIDDSLKRLQTDYIDLYQIHWPARNTPMFGSTSYFFGSEEEKEGFLATTDTHIDEQVLAMNELIQAGKIRHWGLSNENAWGMLSFVESAKKQNLIGPVTNQNAYNLLNRVYEYGNDECSHREGIGLLAYSPLAFGYLSGKYLKGSKGDRRGRGDIFEGFAYRYQQSNVTEAVKEYVSLAEELKLSPTQLALAFVNSRSFVSSNIIGATTIEQLKENISSIEVDLNKEAVKSVNRVHARFTNPAP